MIRFPERIAYHPAGTPGAYARLTGVTATGAVHESS